MAVQSTGPAERLYRYPYNVWYQSEPHLLARLCMVMVLLLLIGPSELERGQRQSTTKRANCLQHQHVKARFSALTNN